ncbi:MAG: hypothetical protein AB1424_02305 [Thermodesulfobacteriota bacterium]
MAKKKQFAGKKTKLAELPLTRALEQKAGEEEAAWEDLQTSAGTSARQLFLSLERTAAESSRTLTAAYQQIMQELMILQADLEPQTGGSPFAPAPLPPAILPSARTLKRALLQARASLQDLHRLLK